MTFKEYSEAADKTAIYPGRGEGNITYPTLGISGEAGEISEKVKKYIRDGVNPMDMPEWKRKLKLEIGDVLFYLDALCVEIGTTLEEAAEANIEKLASRQTRGKLQGSGDDR